MDIGVILAGAAAGAAASIVTAYATYRMTARQDQLKWRAEFAQKYAALVDQPKAAQALARQFAVGVLIVERDDALRERFFIAPHTRITAGRKDDNEIVLPSPVASGRHFAILADDIHAYVEDLGGGSGTTLNDSPIPRLGSAMLRPGDVIGVGDCRIEFQPVKQWA